MYGAYLSGLVLFVQMTGFDVRVLGASEPVAAELGVPGALASQLQQEARLAVKNPPLTTAGSANDPCDLVNAGN